MRSSQLLYCALTLFPQAISALYQDRRAENPTASGQIGVYPPADPVTLVHHDSYLELQGPNTNFYVEEQSTTKWIGVNTEYLTEILTTKTVDGVPITTKAGVPVAVTTATTATDGLVVGDISVALSPAIVDVLNSIAEEAVAACGAKSQKRQSCDVRLEFANRVQAEIRAGGRLDFDLDFLPTISAPDVAAVLEAVTGTKSKALGFFILAWIVASESHGNKEGAPKIPPAVNIPSNVASAPATSTPATSTKSCLPGAPTGADAPICPHDDCKGPNDEPDDSKLACSDGKWKDCPCIREAEAFPQQGDDQNYDGKTWYELQQQFLQDLVDFKEDNGPWCIYGAQPRSNKVPNSYCQCGDNYATFYAKASRTFTPYNPCPYTEAPGPTLVFSTLKPTPTYTAECFPTHGSTEADKIISLAFPDGQIDRFCMDTTLDWQQVGGWASFSNREPVQNNHYDSTFTIASNAPEMCRKLYTEEGKGIEEVQDFCRGPLTAITKQCEFNGGRVTSDCGEWTLQSCPLGGRCKVGEPGEFCETDPGNNYCL